MQTGLDVTIEVDARGRLSRRSIELEDGTSLATTYGYPPDGDPRAAAPIRVTTDHGRNRFGPSDGHRSPGRATRIEEPSGRITRLWYDHLGREVRVEESDPNSTDPDVTAVDWAPHDRPARRERNRVGANGIEEPSAKMVEDFEFDAEGNVASSRLRSQDGTIDRVVTLTRGRIM